MNPVQMGNKMVERVVNMRRLVPPKHDDQRSSLNSLSGTSLNSPDSSGFGSSLSKKSLDMALRHMVIFPPSLCLANARKFLHLN